MPIPCKVSPYVSVAETKCGFTCALVSETDRELGNDADWFYAFV